MSLRPAASSSARHQRQLRRVLLTLAFLSYRPLTDRTSASCSLLFRLILPLLITEIIEAHFVEAHASFGKILDKIKNMWYIKLGVRLDVRGSSGRVSTRLDNYCIVYESM
ncbi:hypothetical protein M9H77_07033 [Catharanthus roseus]|uniref:Uncharacterized protein n=1 Tax=Catharanthus roseus TaxID=4058 RepID=A0ACC0BU12_CATRO|nr:hypothetical protein M9H77_07033 [Catharanthus roseus]